MKQTVTVPMTNLQMHWGDARMDGDIVITVDFKALAQQMGTKAAHNKRRRSQAQKGAIVVQAVNLRKGTI
jgi:hypothetical protein